MCSVSGGGRTGTVKRLLDESLIRSVLFLLRLDLWLRPIAGGVGCNMLNNAVFAFKAWQSMEEIDHFLRTLP